jgi:hypothetical protein
VLLACHDWNLELKAIQIDRGIFILMVILISSSLPQMFNDTYRETNYNARKWKRILKCCFAFLKLRNTQTLEFIMNVLYLMNCGCATLKHTTPPKFFLK